MFDRPDNEFKLSQIMQEKTASQFGEQQEDSVVYEVEAEKQYVNRLKTQREKVHCFVSRLKLFIQDMMFY